jgi:hypothetical protein
MLLLPLQVQQLKATADLLQLQAPQQEQPDPTISNLSSLLTSLSGLQHRQQQWQQQQQQRQSGFLPSPRVPLHPHNHQQSWSNMLPPSSPLDKVTAALQAALEAATSRSTQAAALGPFEGAAAAAASGASSSRRSSLSPWPPNGTATGSTVELAVEGSWVCGVRESLAAANQQSHPNLQLACCNA